MLIKISAGDVGVFARNRLALRPFWKGHTYRCVVLSIDGSYVFSTPANNAEYKQLPKKLIKEIK
jgi:hypothetical protein